MFRSFDLSSGSDKVRHNKMSGKVRSCDDHGGCISVGLSLILLSAHFTVFSSDVLMCVLFLFFSFFFIFDGHTHTHIICFSHVHAGRLFLSLPSCAWVAIVLSLSIIKVREGMN